MVKNLVKEEVEKVEKKEEQRNAFLKDSLGKKIFLSSDEGIEYMRLLVDNLLGKKGVSVRVMSPDVANNINSRDSVADAVVKYTFDDGTDRYINIEINNYHTEVSRIKNLAYIIYLLMKSVPKGKDNKLEDGTEFKKVIPVTQINLNSFDVSEKDQLVVESKIVSDVEELNLYDYVSIFDISLESVAKLKYNEVMEVPRGSLEYILYALVCQDEEFLRKLYEGDTKMEKIVEKIKNLTSEFRPSELFTYEELENASLFELGQNKGKTEGIVKTMLKYKASMKDIIKETGLSKEEILKIKESI